MLDLYCRLSVQTAQWKQAEEWDWCTQGLIAAILHCFSQPCWLTAWQASPLLQPFWSFISVFPSHFFAFFPFASLKSTHLYDTLTEWVGRTFFFQCLIHVHSPQSLEKCNLMLCLCVIISVVGEQGWVVGTFQDKSNPQPQPPTCSGPTSRYSSGNCPHPFLTW